ncbi:MAG: GNAT family N-acetyltransferase [Flavobacteriales bacterium]|nr:GNAT family N-acetyltransferase [Flavobacteriales bacterium]
MRFRKVGESTKGVSVDLCPTPFATDHIDLPIPSLEGSCSERLRFRKVCEADVEPWLAYQWSFVRYERDGSGLHALELLGTGEFVGLCGLLTQEVDGKMELEIGYHLLPGQWHKGFATEAAVFCKAFAREKHWPPQ